MKNQFRVGIISIMLFISTLLPRDQVQALDSDIYGAFVARVNGKTVLFVSGSWPYTTNGYLEVAVDVNGDHAFNQRDVFGIKEVKSGRFEEQFNVSGYEGRFYNVTLWYDREAEGTRGYNGLTSSRLGLHPAYVLRPGYIVGQSIASRSGRIE